MITVLKSGTTADQREQLIRWLEEHGVKVHVSIGENHTILGLVGDTSQIDVEMIKLLDIVQDVKRVSEPYEVEVIDLSMPFLKNRYNLLVSAQELHLLSLLVSSSKHVLHKG